jgi:hypothetical protein
MIINSLLPPTSLQSPTTGQWYIVTTDPKLGWVEVDRKYSWEELKTMWVQKQFKNIEKKVITLPKRIKKRTFSITGSKGNVYKVINDAGIWTCSCPAHGFGRGKDCKHIKALKV